MPRKPKPPAPKSAKKVVAEPVVAEPVVAEPVAVETVVQKLLNPLLTMSSLLFTLNSHVQSNDCYAASVRSLQKRCDRELRAAKNGKKTR